MRNIIHILPKFFCHVRILITVVILVQIGERLRSFELTFVNIVAQSSANTFARWHEYPCPPSSVCTHFYLQLKIARVIILLIALQNCPSSLSLKDTTRKIGAHTAIWCSFILNLALYLSVQTCYWPTS